MVKVTFTFDEETVKTLRRFAVFSGGMLLDVVREAIQDYAIRTDRLSEEERQHLLKVFDRVVPRIPVRRQAEADLEIAAIRAARRTGGRRTRVG
jgi:hypothetical protein